MTSMTPTPTYALNRVFLFIAIITFSVSHAAHAQQATDQTSLKVSRGLPQEAGRSNAEVAARSVSFLPAVTYGSGGSVAQGVAVADLNGDGKPDIVVTNYYELSGGGTPGPIGVLLGNGDGTFRAVVTYESGGGPNYAVVVADVNGDGKPDIIVSSCAAIPIDCGSANGVVSVLLGNGDGTFKGQVSYSSGARKASGLAVADVNGDGIPDVIVTNWYGKSGSDGTVSVLLGKGDGTFESAVNYDSGGKQANSVAVTDVNGDGIPDLVVVNYLCDSCEGGTVGVLLGSGNGMFQPVATYPTGGSNSSGVAVADVNGDGHPDLIVANLNSRAPNGTVGVLLGVGNGKFEPVVTYDSGGYAASKLVVSDVNGDGNLDIVVANCGPVGRCGTGVIGVLLGDGDGTFRTPATFESGAYNATTLTVADLNGDGWPEIVAANAEGSVGVLLAGAHPAGRPRPDGFNTCNSRTVLTSPGSPSEPGSIRFTASALGPYGGQCGGNTITSCGPADVAFYANGTPIGTVGIPSQGNCVVTLIAKPLPVGKYDIKAVYSGTGFLQGSSDTISQVVIGGPTTTTLSSSPSPSTYGQQVAFTAIVYAPFTLAGFPSGKVSFRSGPYNIGTVTLSDYGVGGAGIALLTRSNLDAYTYPLVAVYSGDEWDAGSSSAVLNQVVIQTISTAILTSSPNPSQQGESVAFKVHVTSPTVTAEGPVTFSIGKTVLGAVQLKGGGASFDLSTLPVGTNNVTATYLGDSNTAGSSASVTQVVEQSGGASSATTLTWSENPN